MSATLHAKGASSTIVVGVRSSANVTLGALLEIGLGRLVCEGVVRLAMESIHDLRCASFEITLGSLSSLTSALGRGNWLMQRRIYGQPHRQVPALVICMKRLAAKGSSGFLSGW